MYRGEKESLGITAKTCKAGDTSLGLSEFRCDLPVFCLKKAPLAFLQRIIRGRWKVEAQVDERNDNPALSRDLVVLKVGKWLHSYPTLSLPHAETRLELRRGQPVRFLSRRAPEPGGHLETQAHITRCQVPVILFK